MRKDADLNMIQMLSDKDFKQVIITMLYEVKVNTLEMKGKTEVLSREIVTIKRTKWKHKNPNSKIPEILKITV